MKAYIQIETGTYPLFDEDIKAMFPNVSFSNPFTAPAGFAEVVRTARPPVAPTQIARETAPIQDGDIWKQTWQIETVDDTVAAARIARQWSAVRSKRDKLLRESDWIVSVSDSPLTPEKTAEWVTYRQALRAMTDASDPFTVKWPTEPKA
jgi:hypothetical protein